ncbi:hypothetical protein NQ318_008259 [Aromia moschata]|uniref:Uncharacterized protein n=1 Tax=Aromia moschata TaxID=1265417 RepID=A0AAV8Y6Z4_9CUCU|nr:hypothetical protein NQ318_008259 [Aromia moschata]
MLEESKDVIIKNFLAIMKQCNVDALKEIMVNKGVFSTTEMRNMFSSSDARHNNRLFFSIFKRKNKEHLTFLYILYEKLTNTT